MSNPNYSVVPVDMSDIDTSNANDLTQVIIATYDSLGQLRNRLNDPRVTFSGGISHVAFRTTEEGGSYTSHERSVTITGLELRPSSIGYASRENESTEGYIGSLTISADVPDRDEGGRLREDLFLGLTFASDERTDRTVDDFHGFASEIAEMHKAYVGVSIQVHPDGTLGDQEVTLHYPGLARITQGSPRDGDDEAQQWWGKLRPVTNSFWNWALGQAHDVLYPAPPAPEPSQRANNDADTEQSQPPTPGRVEKIRRFLSGVLSFDPFDHSQ